MDNNINLDLMQFIETSILPQYNAFGRSHGIQHVQRVIERSLQLAKTIGADINMAYVVAAYHDIGMSGPRAIQPLFFRRPQLYQRSGVPETTSCACPP